MELECGEETTDPLTITVDYPEEDDQVNLFGENAANENEPTDNCDFLYSL